MGLASLFWWVEVECLLELQAHVILQHMLCVSDRGDTNYVLPPETSFYEEDLKVLWGLKVLSGYNQLSEVVHITV